ncbi:MAG TPA: hypothetical protein VKM54_17450 [Myxococcota bacterium]|nr:hypothetical protein [Myxococcota bacterium]
MQKIFGALFILVAIWIAIEVYTKGTDGAFGGLFADHSRAQASVQSGGALPGRVRDRVKGAFRAHEERTLQQTDPDDQRAEQ